MSDEFAENTDNRFTHFSTGPSSTRTGTASHHLYDYDPKTKSREPTGIQLDMDEYEECPYGFVMLAKRYYSFVIRNEKEK